MPLPERAARVLQLTALKDPGADEAAELARWADPRAEAPYRIVPHWRSNHHETEGDERAAAHLADSGLLHRCLRDGEVVYIHNTTGPVS
ncbi:hypothetical protein ABZ553_31240 [Streptomyces sparsogenes]|uniref:hypothetical protein n=1 Tax=Streptomyces sparsogenes TaxID=67365 RepID=UPI0033FBAECE